jgi:hypothetical protein
MIPMTYAQDRNTPPIFIQLFGLSGTGKTTFLDMLRLHLYDMDQIWPGFHDRPLTQLDADHKQILLTERRQGIMPGSTPKRERNQNEAYIMYLHYMERWRSCFLVLMDHAGEYFRQLNVPVGEVPFLQHAPVTILLLSLPDMERDGQRVNDVLNSYITSLERIGVNFVQRQVVIVLNKADRISNLPRALSDYLISDTIYMSLRDRRQLPVLDQTAINQYIGNMQYIDGIIADWLKREIPGGAAMLGMLSAKGIQVRFTVMSATGHELSGNAATIEPAPRRVLDPFFWVLEFYKWAWQQQEVVQQQAQVQGIR